MKFVTRLVGRMNNLGDGHAVVEKLKLSSVEILKQAMVGHTERNGARRDSSYPCILVLSWRRVAGAQFMMGYDKLTGAHMYSCGNL